jgi:hypothetical protein
MFTPSVTTIPLILLYQLLATGSAGGIEDKALRYKPAGRCFDSQCFHWNFSVI